jgi:outer membrane receptor protein involved in Fe transport
VGLTAVAGNGKRDRYAVTTELRLPVLDQLTLSLSGRYDKFSPDGAKSYDKPTYNIGFEYRPFESLLIRGKYGTAFKAPTLADNFQGMSGYYNYVVDYYNCAIRGYSPENVDNCPTNYTSRQFKGTTSGSTDLKPMTADVWSYGFVWSPLAKLSVSADFCTGTSRTKSAPRMPTV